MLAKQKERLHTARLKKMLPWAAAAGNGISSVFFQLGGKTVADRLQPLYEDDQKDDGDIHDVRFVTEIAEPVGEVPQPACPDEAGHRGRTDEPNRGDR